MFLWQCVAKYLRANLDEIKSVEQLTAEEQEIVSFFGLDKWKEMIKGYRKEPLFVLATRLQEEEAHGCCEFSLEPGKFGEYLAETFKPMIRESGNT